jgi:hypothetical protein
VNRVFFQRFSSSSRVQLEYLFTRYAFNLLNNYQDKFFIKKNWGDHVPIFQICKPLQVGQNGVLMLREIILVFVSGSQKVMYVINCIPGSVYFLISYQRIQYGAK